MSRITEPKVLTLQEANQAIPGLRRSLAELRKIRDELDRIEGRLVVLDLICDRTVGAENADLGEYLSSKYSFHQLVARFDEVLTRLESRGLLVRDLEEGIVHFLAQRGGEPVLLCWKEGEERVSHWHEIDLDEGGSGGEEDRRDIESWDDA